MKYALISRDRDKSLEVANFIKSNIQGEEDLHNPEVVIAVGGDGTILKAVHMYPNAVIFGVHTGHLGFYANYDSATELNQLVDDINNGSYNINEVDILEAIFRDKKGRVTTDFALNEFTIVCPPRTLRLDVFIDDEYFERFRGTGFALSTPTGSTAYNKSLDGSVIDTSLSVMQLTEIAGINSNSYRTLSSPLVLSSERTVRLLAKEYKADVYITADHISYKVDDFDMISIAYKKKAIKMAYHKNETFLNRINRTFIISKD